MHNHPDPDALDGALMILGALFILCLAGATWIENHIEKRRQQEREQADNALDAQLAIAESEAVAVLNRLAGSGKTERF